MNENFEKVLTLHWAVHRYFLISFLSFFFYPTHKKFYHNFFSAIWSHFSNLVFEWLYAFKCMCILLLWKKASLNSVSLACLSYRVLWELNNCYHVYSWSCNQMLYCVCNCVYEHLCVYTYVDPGTQAVIVCCICEWFT